MNSNNKKLIIIGLDCATPRTLFQDFLEDCPTLKMMMNKGVYGKLRSSDPPITIPAWMVMATGKKAGTLGIYGFRHRNDYSYTDYGIANSYLVKEKTIWDILGENGKNSCVLGLPPSYPVKPMKGCMVAGFITPDVISKFTYPPELKDEIKENVGDYILDADFRIKDKRDLLLHIYEMTDIHFKTIKFLIKNKEWTFFQFVIIGLDRLHHAFWKYYDSSHHLHESGNRFEAEMRKFYIYLDKKVKEILDLLDENTTVMVVSDHGAKAMKGLICVNMALEKLGYLKFKKKHEPRTRIGSAEIDWNNTYAWGWGGHYARIFLNVKGREKHGIINMEDYEDMRGKISESLRNIKDDKGNPMDTKVYRPEDLYEKIRGDPPDLMVYFDDLNWRPAGTIGYKSMYLRENDTGPDDAVHDYHGIFIIFDPKEKIGKNLGTKNILDIAPTSLKILGIEIPEDFEGKIIKY